MELPPSIQARTAGVRVADPLFSFASLFNGGDTIFGGIIEKIIQNLITNALPDAAKRSIESMSFGLGGSLAPSNEGWVKAHKWAVVLVILLSLLCAAILALVVLCIVLERRVVAKEAREMEDDRDTVSFERVGDSEHSTDADSLGDADSHYSSSEEYEDEAEDFDNSIFMENWSLRTY